MKNLMLALLVSSVAVSAVVAEEAERSFVVMDTVTGEIDIFGEDGSFVAITENVVDGSLNVEAFDNQENETFVTTQTTDVAISSDDSVVSDS
ncbi:MAG: hypothetical protein QG604_730 [Candidatus Dependentiae bacterium]|nr:hypothetical protein [Candidatus Dependentiae bacterium]